MEEDGGGLGRLDWTYEEGFTWGTGCWHECPCTASMRGC